MKCIKCVNVNVVISSFVMQDLFLSLCLCVCLSLCVSVNRKTQEEVLTS